MILTINAGSSTIKYALFKGEKEVEKGVVERIKKGGYRKALIRIITGFGGKRLGEIKAVAHRVVHGKDVSGTVLLCSRRINQLKKVSELAPLHNPSEIAVAEEAKKLIPVNHYAVFDTAFHTTMPNVARIYGIPYRYYDSGVKRYGFHGTSYKYIAEEAGKLIGKNKKMIICHLGNGCSVCAVNKGKSADTSMGFTPLEGLMMGTRSGDIDPAVISYIMRKEGKTENQVEEMLNKDSGLLGISRESNDMRDLLKSKSKRAKLAIDVFCYRIAKYIGAYAAVLNGVDAIIFSAGIGENVGGVREKILERFNYLGLKLDKKKNKKNELVVTKPSSKVKVLVIPTDEAKMMAREVNRIISA